MPGDFNRAIKAQWYRFLSRSAIFSLLLFLFVVTVLHARVTDSLAIIDTLARSRYPRFYALVRAAILIKYLNSRLLVGRCWKVYQSRILCNIFEELKARNSLRFFFY